MTHLENELELNGLEDPNELQINTVSQKPTKTNADRRKPTCHHCERPGPYRNQCHLSIKQQKQTESTQKNHENKNSGTKNNNNNNNYHKNSNGTKRKPKNAYPHCETCGKTNHSTEKCYFGANAATRQPPRHRRPEEQNQVQKRANQSDSSEVAEAAAKKLKLKCHVFTPELQLETTNLLLPPILDVVWWQPHETHLNIIQKFQ